MIGERQGDLYGSMSKKPQNNIRWDLESCELNDRVCAGESGEVHPDNQVQPDCAAPFVYSYRILKSLLDLSY